MAAQNIEPPMPPRPQIPLVYIADEIGLYMSGGMDVAPLSAREVQAWCEMMGETLSPWEFRTLRRMSQAYVSGLRSEKAPFAALDCKLALASAAIMGGL